MVDGDEPGGESRRTIDSVVDLVRTAGGEAFVSRGVSRTIIGLVGDVEQFATLNLQRDARGQRRGADLRAVQAGQPGASPGTLGDIGARRADRAGHADGDRRAVRGRDARADARGGADGAGRRGVAAARRRVQAAHLAVRLPGPGRGRAEDPGRRAVRDGPADRHRGDRRRPTSTWSCSYADMLQVGTRNMQNFPLLQAVGAAGKPVMLKRGMNATIEEWLMAAEYIAQRGNLDIVLCERGIRTFETATRNTLDISADPGGPAAVAPAGHRGPVALGRAPRPGAAAVAGRDRGRRRRHHHRRAPAAGDRAVRRRAGADQRGHARAGQRRGEPAAAGRAHATPAPAYRRSRPRRSARRQFAAGTPGRRRPAPRPGRRRPAGARSGAGRRSWPGSPPGAG